MPPLPDDLWRVILRSYCGESNRAAKELRKIARTCSIFAELARMHPDNNLPMTLHMEEERFMHMWAGD